MSRVVSTPSVRDPSLLLERDGKKTSGLVAFGLVLLGLFLFREPCQGTSNLQYCVHDLTLFQCLSFIT